MKRKPTVLLVDDEQIVRRMLAYTLEDAGFAVVEAGNGAAALQLARNLRGALSLVVTDLDMPVMNGLELGRALQMTEPDLPIIVITGTDPALAVESGLNAEVLLKPFGPDDFLDVVTRLITHHPARRRADDMARETRAF